MSAYQAQRSSRVQTLAESGYRGKLHLQLNDNCAPVTFVWWAATPKGRDSIHTLSFTFERLRCAGLSRIGERGEAKPVYVPTAYWWKSIQDLHGIAKARNHVLLKNLPSGYVWYGPYLYSEIKPPVNITVEPGAEVSVVPGVASDALHMAGIPEREAKVALAAQLARRALQGLGIRQLSGA